MKEVFNSVIMIGHDSCIIRPSSLGGLNRRNLSAKEEVFRCKTYFQKVGNSGKIP